MSHVQNATSVHDHNNSKSKSRNKRYNYLSYDSMAWEFWLLYIYNKYNLYLINIYLFNLLVLILDIK